MVIFDKELAYLTDYTVTLDEDLKDIDGNALTPYEVSFKTEYNPITTLFYSDFEGTAEELDGLAENVLLGTFEKGDSTVLTAKLSVPIELGNEYANRVGEVDWVFVAEELNNPAPETGDTTNANPYVGLLVAAGVAVVGLGGFMFYKKKKDKDQE